MAFGSNTLIKPHKIMSTAIAPQRPIDERPPESLNLPSLQVPLRDRRDESNQSHSIKEIFVEKPFKELPKRFSQTAPTPRARGDGIHHFESKDEDDCEVENRIKKRSMVDPPGFNESSLDISLTKQGSMDPETAASVHRRRKRALEQRARKIMGGPSDVPGKRIIDIDDTESTADSSQHSSWVPTRRIESDPNTTPIYNFAPGPALSRQTMEVRNRAVPRRPWRPARQLSEKRNTLADDEMEFSTTNEWVPSEFYRKHKPLQAMQVFPTGTPHVLSSYSSNQQPQYQEYGQQLHHQQQQLQRQRQYIQKQLQLQQEVEAQKQLLQQMQKGKTQYRPHRLPNQPPSIIHTITTATTPSTPTPDNAPSLVHTITTAATPSTTIPENDPLKRKSMDSEMDWSDVVMSSTESDTMMGSKLKPKNRESEESSTVLDSEKNKKSDESKAPTKESEESSTIQDSLIALIKTKKRWSDDSKDPKEAEEHSTIQDSLKRREGKNASEDVSLKPSSFLKIMNKEFSFENQDDGFDESLLSASLTQLDIPRNINVIPSIFVRKSGTSDITLDLDATRFTLTSDEDLTWGSTIHNSIISQEDVAIAAAAAAAKEINQMNLSHKDSKNSSSAEVNTGGTAGSLLGSGTSGFTGGTIKLNSLTESALSGLTASGALKGKDAFGNTNHTTAITDEIGARARRKMEVIPSEVSSYVSNTLSQNRQDSEGDSRSSWHHRSNITTTSTMVSTKKVANKKNKFKPRRSSTSTLPSIGSIIPEESWDYADAAYDIEEEDEDEDDDDDEDDKDLIDEIEIIDSDGEDDDNMEEAELERKLSSILEVASRDRSGTNSRDISRELSVEDSIVNSVPDSVDIESGDESGDKESSSDLGRSNRKRTCWEYCACLELRCFEVRDDGRRGKFKPTVGVYIVTFLVLILLTVWTGIGILLFRVLRS